MSKKKSNVKTPMNLSLIIIENEILDLKHWNNLRKCLKVMGSPSRVKFNYIVYNLHYPPTMYNQDDSI